MVTRQSLTIAKTLFSWVLTLLVALVVWHTKAPPAYAHRPHDVVPQVVVSPSYDQDNTVFALVRKNLLRSNDGGETWFRLNNGLDNRRELNGLAMAPNNQSILYITTAGDGVYGSRDGGNTWAPLNNGVTEPDLLWVEAAPNNAQLAFTQSHDGHLYRTETGGDQWLEVLDNVAAVSMAFAPNGSFVLLGDEQGQIWRSEDGGVSWQMANQLNDVGAVETIAIAAEIYIGTELAGVYRSGDGLQTVTPMNQGLSDLRSQDLRIAPSGELLLSTWEAGMWRWDSTQWRPMAQGLTRDKQADDMDVPHFEEIAISPAYQQDATLFLGGFDGLFRSQDAGRQWQELEALSYGTVVSMAVSPTYAEDQTVAIATYVGELYVTNDGGNTWQTMHENLHLPLSTSRFRPLDAATDEQDPRRFFDIALSSNYAQDSTLFSSILYTKILRSTDGGQQWSVHPLAQEVRGVSLAVSPNFEADQTIFSTNQKGIIFRSQDGGKHYEKIGKLDKQHGNDSPSLVISPDFINDKTLFNTGMLGIYKSDNAGKSWSLLTDSPEFENLPAAQIAISPNFADDQTLFVASGQGLYRTEDGGQTWENLNSTSYGDNPFIEAIDVSPNYVNDKTVMASVRGRGLFKSQDGGSSFKTVGDPNLVFSRYTHVPCAGRALQFSPNYAEDSTVFGFGAVDTAIYKSTDGGETWNVLSVPRLRINQISTARPLQTVGMFLNINKRRLLGLSILAALSATGFFLFKRVSFGQISTRRISLLLCIASVAAAFGWVIFARLPMIRMTMLLLIVAIGAGWLWQLSSRGLITFPNQTVQGCPKTIVYDAPKWLKVTVVTLVILRLIFSITHLADKPYNADEVRGFYRLSGYYEEEIKQEAFRGQILTVEDLQVYQTPSDTKTFGDTLTSLATSPEHTPGYYALSWLWVKLWQTPLSARILAVLLGLLALPWAYWLCLELFHSAFSGWVAVALLSLSPYHLLLAQGARQYSLSTLLMLAASVFLLQALRLRQGYLWLSYGASVALGLYSHLFFAFLLMAHGVYMLVFERRHMLAFLAAAGAGILAFGPWVWVIGTSLNTIDENTQGVRNRNSTLIEIVRFTRDKVGDLFLNLNNTSSLERLANPLFLVLVALSIYCLLRWTPSRVWVFLLLPLVVNYSLLAPPDLLMGGERSLRSRYLLTAFLSVTLAVAFFLANAIKRSTYRWERLTWTAVFAGLLVCGVASGVTVAKTPGLDYLEQGRTASVVNQELAPLINASAKPLVVSAATHSFALALSYEVHNNVSFQLVQDLEPQEWSAAIDLYEAEATYSDVFVYFPNKEFLAFLERDYSGTLEPVFEKNLYQAVDRPNQALLVH